MSKKTKHKCKDGLKGDKIQPVPGSIYHYPKMVQTAQVVRSLLHLHGRGLYRKVTLKRGKKAVSTDISSWNGFITAEETPSMYARGKDFYGISDGNVLGDKELKDKFVTRFGPFDAADPTFDRIDYVVLEPAEDKDLGKTNQGGQHTIIKGIPGSSPQPPIVNGEDEIELAKVRIRAGATSLLPSDFTDCRKFLMNTDELMQFVLDEIGNALSGPVIQSILLRLDALEQAIGDYSVVGATLSAAILDLRNQIESMYNELCEDTSKITPLQGSVAAAKATSVTLVASTATFKAAVDTNEPDLSIDAGGISAKVTALDDKIIAFDSVVQGLWNQPSLSADTILSLQGNYSSITEQISVIMVELGTLAPTHASVISAMATMTANLSTMMNDMFPMLAKIQALVDCIALTFVSVPLMQKLYDEIWTGMGTATGAKENLIGQMIELEKAVQAAQVWDTNAYGPLKAYIDGADGLIQMAVTANAGDITALAAQVTMLSNEIAGLKKTMGNLGDAPLRELQDGISQYGCSVGPDGRIYVCEYGSSISVLEPDGSVVSSHSPASLGVTTVIDTAVNSAGTKLALMDLGGAQVGVVDLPGMTPSHQFGSYGSANGEFMSPRGIAFDSSDNIYCADRSRHDVQKFNLAGVFQAAFGTSGVSGNGIAPLALSSPQAVSVRSNGNILIADRGNNRIIEIDSSGAFVNVLGSPTGTSLVYGSWNGAGTIDGGLPSFVGSDYTPGMIQADDGWILACWNTSYLSYTADGLSWGMFGTGLPDIGAGGVSLAKEPSGKIYLFCDDQHGAAAQTGYLSVSSDNGFSWSPLTVISEFADCNWGLDIVAIADNVLLASYYKGSGSNTLPVFKSIDGGATWTQVLADLSSGSGQVDQPKFAVKGSKIYAFFWEQTGLRYRESTDAGATWSVIKSAAEGAHYQPGNAFVDLDGNIVVGVTAADNISYFVISTDDGATWKAPLVAYTFPGTETPYNGQKPVCVQRDPALPFASNEVVMIMAHTGLEGFVTGRSVPANFAGNNVDGAYDVEALSDGGAVASSLFDHMVVRYDANGISTGPIRWDPSFSGNLTFVQAPWGLAEAPNGGIIVQEWAGGGSARVLLLLTQENVISKLNELIIAYNVSPGGTIKLLQ